MARYFKYILLIVLAFVGWQTAGSAFTGQSVDVKKCIAAQNDVIDVDAVFQRNNVACFNSSPLPYKLDAELLNGGGQAHLFTSMRVQRSHAAEYLLSLKDCVNQLTQYVACLSLHREKLHDATAYYRCQPVCEYYIFALRRILI